MSFARDESDAGREQKDNLETAPKAGRPGPMLYSRGDLEVA